MPYFLKLAGNLASFSFTSFSFTPFSQNIYPMNSLPRFSKQKYLGFFLGWLVLSCSYIEAAMDVGEVVLVDFGTVIPVAGASFNDFSDVVIADDATESFGGSLVNSTGEAVSGLGFNVTNRSGQDTGRATGNSGAEGLGLFSDNSVFSDWLLSNDANGARLTDGDAVIDGSGDRGHLLLTFTGLDDSLRYNLSGGFDNNNSNFNAIWQADGQSFTTNGEGGIGYGSLTGLNTDGNGNLVIAVIRTGDANGLHIAVAGLALEAVAGAAPSFGVGDEIRVDFGTILPIQSNYNIINSGVLSVPSLVRFSDGEAVDVGLSVSATTPFDNSGNVASASGFFGINSEDPEVYEDGFLSTDGNNGAGNDTVVLTFTGLDDSLYYNVSGGLSRSSGSSNFATTWASSGVSSQVTDGSPVNGDVEFLGLSSIGGSLSLTLTDEVRQSGLAQLTLAATDIPPGIPPTSVLPSITNFTFEDDETLLLEMDKAGSNFLLQQSDDLAFFDTVAFSREGTDDEVLRIEGVANMDPNGDGRSFYRTARQPNFVVIFTDDQGYQDLSCYGSPTIQTPRIDALAQQGIRFTDFYAQPVCGPSRDAFCRDSS